jgi:recombination protein RecA
MSKVCDIVVEAKIRRNMTVLARPDLESLLRTRKLDRTLTSPHSTEAVAGNNTDLVAAPTGVTALDAHLGGGFPRGQLSELVGVRSSGRTSVLLQMLAAATARRELTALVDALDMFDASCASSAGVDFDRFLWIRGHVVTNPGMCRDMNQRAVEQAVKALTLVLHAGNFGLVVLDMAEAPIDALRRLPFTTWLRLQRIVEGTQTACVLIGAASMARSSAGITLRLGSPVRPHASCQFRGRLFAGLDVTASVIRARSHIHEETAVMFNTVASPDV